MKDRFLLTSARFILLDIVNKVEQYIKYIQWMTLRCFIITCMPCVGVVCESEKDTTSIFQMRACVEIVHSLFPAVEKSVSVPRKALSIGRWDSSGSRL